MKKSLTICLSIMTALTLTSCLGKKDVSDMLDKRKGDLGYIHNDTEHAVDLYFPWLGEELHYHIAPGKVYELDELDFWHIKQDFTLDTRTMRFCFDDGTHAAIDASLTDSIRTMQQRAIQNNLTCYEAGIYELEHNYAGFDWKVTDDNRAEYEQLRQEYRDSISMGAMYGPSGVAEQMGKS